MDRTLAEFPDGKTASVAVNRLIASSFDKDDLELFAVPTEGPSVRVPIVHRSHFGTGFLLGGVLSVPIGLAMWASFGLQSSPSLALLAIGLGCTLGATLGVGWWNVIVDKRSIPRDAERFVLAVRGPAGRAAHAQSVMQDAGGSDATPRSTSPAPSPSAQ